MKTARLSQAAGILMLVVFAVNAYLGAYDTNLSSNTPHYYANWAIAVVTLVAGLVLLARPSSKRLVALAGVVWPVVYVLLLAGDVYTKMCAGVSAESCWPSKTAAFDYLILNQGTIKGAPGYGWKLAPVMPIAIIILVMIFVLSVAAIMAAPKGTTATPLASQPSPGPAAPAAGSGTS